MIDHLEELLRQVEEPESGGQPVVVLPSETLPNAAAKKGGRGEAEGEGPSVRPVTAQTPLSVPVPAAEGGSALSGLYRQLVRERTAEGPARAASVAVVRESVPHTPGLTAGELDRAMRRDSRRYDGVLTIY